MRKTTRNLAGPVLARGRNRFTKHSFARLAALLACLGLGACAGDDVTTGPSIGYVIDAPVGGISYTCGALTGATASDGSFHYDAGTACTFTVGAMPSDGIVTPHDLAGVSRSDALNANAVAIAQFLQSLDDGTQSGSINIPAAVVAALATTTPTSLLSSTLTPAQIQSQLSTLVSIATKGAKTLISPELAAANLNTYLQAAYPNLNPSAGVVPPTANSSVTDVPKLAVAFPAILTASNTSVGFSATSDVDAIGYWEILPASAGSPSQWQVISGLDSKNVSVVLSGKGSMTAATTASFDITGLAYSTAYKLYFVLANANATGKVTQVYSSSITTGGVPQAPTLSPSSIPAISSTDGSAAFTLTSDVTGTGYWVVLSTGTAPTAAQVIAGTDASNAAASKKGSTQMTAATAASISVSGLAYSSSYTLYFAATNLSDTSKVSQELSVSIQTGPPPINNLSGTAAVGERLAFATITVFDSKGSLVGTTTTDANGQYSIAVGSQFERPFVVKAEGSAGDASVTLYSVASSEQVNVNQITNAISASLVTSGDLAELESGTSANADTIANAESAYTAVLGDSIANLSATASLISGTFDDKYDRLLDNISVTVKPTGEVTIATSAGMKGDDLGVGASVSDPYAFLSVAPGSLPAGVSLSALTESQTLASSDLEYLRKRIETCFSFNSASRGTVQSPISECQGLDSSSGGETFLHSGYYWLDTTSTCTNSTTSINVFCRGMFGYMLTQAKFDGLQFGTPLPIRPLNDTSWIAKFPVVYNQSNDNSYGTQCKLGEVVSNVYMVVKKYPQLATGSDPGWRFYGDQRTVGSFVEATTQRTILLSIDGNRYETGLSLWVNANALRYYGNGSQDMVYFKKIVVTGKGLPSAGITLFNKGTAGTNASGRGTWTNSCGGNPILSATDGEWTTNSNVVCAAAIRLSSTGTPTANPASTPRFMAYWGAQDLTDAQIAEIHPGEPYTFVITLSNGTVLNYVNRVHAQPLGTADLQRLNYPTFTAATIDALKTFTGQSSTFTIAWDKIKTSKPYSAALYWNKAAFSASKGITNEELVATSVALPCTSTNGCTTAANWSDGLGGSVSNRGAALMRTRQLDGYLIFTNISTF